MFGTEYRHEGKTYLFVMPDDENSRKLACAEQRSMAHQINGHLSGIYEGLAETWAIMLGITKEEAAELPLRLLIQMSRDVEAASENLKKVLG